MSGPSAWMPIYIGDYLGDTQRLTTEQHGAYLLLLFDYWRNGPPPIDDAVLAQITRLPRQAWRKIKPIILGYFDERDGRLHHGRVDKELANAAKNQDRRTAKAKKAADARWHGGDDAPSNAPSMPQALPVECPPPSPSSDTDVSGETPVDPVKALFDLGISALMEDGHTERAARGFVGKWRKEQGEGATSAALLDAIKFGITDKMPWIEARFAKKTTEQDAYLTHLDRKFAATGRG